MIRYLMSYLVLATVLADSGVEAQSQSVQDPQSVSIIQLIATPQRYEGVRVRVRGTYYYGREESALYLHQEDADRLNAENAIWLSPGTETKNAAPGSFVIVEGFFTAKEHGHMGAFPGTITRVSRIQAMRSRKDYEAMTKPEDGR